MAFTYDLDETGTNLLISKVRLEIGDAVEDTGVKPDQSNFSDAELTLVLTEEGSSVGRSAARCFEILANWWARFADLKVGPRSEALSKVAKGYADRAKEYRQQHGGGVAVYAYGLTRKDGYSDDEPSDDVSAGGEYGLDFRYYRPERSVY